MITLINSNYQYVFGTKLKGGNCTIEQKVDGKDFKVLMSAFDILGFTKQEQDNIFKILSSVLHIGNIYFNRKQVCLLPLSPHPFSIA
jgi:myosin heavy subunit